MTGFQPFSLRPKFLVQPHWALVVLATAAVGCSTTTGQQAHVAPPYKVVSVAPTRWTPPVTAVAPPSATLSSANAERVQLAKAERNPANGKLSNEQLQSLRKRIPSLWPVEIVSKLVMSPFGMRGKGKKSDMHKGADIKAPLGTPVVATADGVVKFSGTMNGYGNIVVIDHGDGIESAYGHLLEREVAVGESVTQGEPIGKTGATGRATTPHVHYEVRENGVPIDPQIFLPAS